MLSKQIIDVKTSSIHKYFLLIGIFLVILLFGDSLLLFFAHLLHVAFEFIASILEHGLQVAFNLSERQAQIALFYIVLLIGSVIAWQLSKCAYRKSKALYLQASCQVCQMLEKVNWLKITFIFSAMSASLFLFT